MHQPQEPIPCVPALEGLLSLNFKQSFVAEQLGVSQAQVSNWRHGKAGLTPVEVFTLTALLGLAVRTAEENQGCTELTEAQRQTLKVRADVARAWLDLQQTMNVDLPEEERAHALALYELRVEHLRRRQRAPAK